MPIYRIKLTFDWRGQESWMSLCFTDEQMLIGTGRLALREPLRPPRFKHRVPGSKKPVLGAMFARELKQAR